MKLLLSFAGRGVRRLIPQAGLLGSLAGIALMLIGFFPLVELLEVPVVGVLTLGLVLYALVGKGRIPGRVPGVLFAVIVGTLAYYGLGGLRRGRHGDRNTGAADAAPRVSAPRCRNFAGLCATRQRICR